MLQFNTLSRLWFLINKEKSNSFFNKPYCNFANYFKNGNKTAIILKFCCAN